MTRNIIQVDPDKFPWLDLRRYTFSMGVEKDGVAVLSGQTASAYDKAEGHVVCKGDIAEQCQVAWEKLGVILDAAGMGYENLVRTVDYITPQGLALYRKTANVRRKHLKNTPVASTGVVVHSLLRPDALIEVNAMAAKGKKTAISPGGAAFERYRGLTYAPGVRVGDKVWLSGLAETEPPDSAAGQMERCYKNIETILAAAGATCDDVINLTEYVAPQAMSQYPAARSLRDRFFRRQTPASSSVVMHRLLRSQAHVETEATAVTGGQREEIRIPQWEPAYRELRAMPAVKKGKVMYISGQGSMDPSTGQTIVDDYDLVSQARRAYQNLARLCAEAGMSVDAIAYTLEFTPPTVMHQVRGLQQVRKEVFGSSFPAATGITPHRLLNPKEVFSVAAVALV